MIRLPVGGHELEGWEGTGASLIKYQGSGKIEIENKGNEPFIAEWDGKENVVNPGKRCVLIAPQFDSQWPE